MNNYVRIGELKIKNFKNVKYGSIKFSSRKTDFLNTHSDIIGIYGQNGSGKTTAIQALKFIQTLIRGDQLQDNLNDYITIGENTASLEVEFIIYISKERYVVKYIVEFRRPCDEFGSCTISKEELYIKKPVKGKKSYPSAIIKYDIDNKNLINPKSRRDEILSNNESAWEELIKAGVKSCDDNFSFIFANRGFKIFSSVFNDKVYCEIIKEIHCFSRTEMCVITNNRAGYLFANIAMPLMYRIDEKSDNNMIRRTMGDMRIPINEPITVPNNSLNQIEKVIDSINIVICKIIPGMQIEVANHGPQTLMDGTVGNIIELLSVRGNNKIPIRYESDGIKKIFMMLDTLINMYNNKGVFIAIDEIDSGVFEYLLSEIIKVIYKNGKGQLLFTAHNLTALETLPKECLLFSTTNINNRYIDMKYIRNSNNLRDSYLRALVMGGQDEIMYDDTSEYEIDYAFRRAGNMNV